MCPEVTVPSEMSRHLAELSGVNVLVHFAQDLVKLTRSDIALHLLIPFVVFPAMEPGREFGPLVKRKLFDGGLDLGRLEMGSHLNIQHLIPINGCLDELNFALPSDWKM